MAILGYPSEMQENAGEDEVQRNIGENASERSIYLYSSSGLKQPGWGEARAKVTIMQAGQRRHWTRQPTP